MDHNNTNNRDENERNSWDKLKKRINALVNKVTASNVGDIVPELFMYNLIRGRGLLCRAIIKSQMASPDSTQLLAAMVTLINVLIPDVILLLLKRIIFNLRMAYECNDKSQLLASTIFIAHLVNQRVAHEVIALDLLVFLLENPTNDSLEAAVVFLQECGSLLSEIAPKALHGVFETLRGIVYEGEVDERVIFLIENCFAIRRADFQGYPPIQPELDLMKDEIREQCVVHEISLLSEIDPETELDVFRADPHFTENETKFERLIEEKLGFDSNEGLSMREEEKIEDKTETDLVNLRKTIYPTIMSTLNFEQAGHRLLQLIVKQEIQVSKLIVQCCSKEKYYRSDYGLAAQRLCMLKRGYQQNFARCFVDEYCNAHRLGTESLRNVAKFFGNLLGTGALPLHHLACIRLTEEDTNSSSRNFIKILFQELVAILGIRGLNERLSDPTLQDRFNVSIFPKDDPKKTRFSINFFTCIGLGGITDNMREYLQNRSSIYGGRRMKKMRRN